MSASKSPVSPYQGGTTVVATSPKGAVANAQMIAATAPLEPRLHRVTDKIWSAVGFGMSNSIALEAPEGLIVVETGEGLEEAEDQRQALRSATQAPLRAVIYTHNHYAHGTPSWLKEVDPSGGTGDVQIWGHENIPRNIVNTASEIGPAYIRRTMTQFSYYLPEDGPDSMPNQGIGVVFYHKNRPTTRRFVTPTNWVRGETTVKIAGTTVQFVPAPSDADDSMIVYLPEMGCVVNNHIWPCLFNIYTLRGEAYRDPLVLIKGIDRIREMDPEHLVGVHGAPISTRARTRQALADYRDSIQFIWDQTVRGMNDGLSMEEIVDRVRLPAALAASPYIPQSYGEVGFHVRAVHTGLLGWYDMEGSKLHPLAPQDEARQMIAGFGGRAAMEAKTREALAARNFSWAAQLATYLVRDTPSDTASRQLKADALRGIAQVTTASNTRSVCLTQAWELEGRIDPVAKSQWRANRFQILNAAPLRFLEALRVQLDPEKSSASNLALELHVTDKDVVGNLHVVGGVARYSAGKGPDHALRLETTHAGWADLYTGKKTLAELVATDVAKASPSVDAVAQFFELFDHVRVT